MDNAELAWRLDAQERLLQLILAVVEPETETDKGSGFEALIAVLADLTEAVSDVTAAVAGLLSNGCGRCRPEGD